MRVFQVDGEWLPRGGQADVVVAVVVPVVVDIEPVLVEVADIDTVAVRSDIVCPSSSVALEIEVYCQTAYILSFLYFIREQATELLSPLKMSKKFYLHLVHTLS